MHYFCCNDNDGMESISRDKFYFKSLKNLLCLHFSILIISNLCRCFVSKCLPQHPINVSLEVNNLATMKSAVSLNSNDQDDETSSYDSPRGPCISLAPYQIKIGRKTVDIRFGTPPSAPRDVNDPISLDRYRHLAFLRQQDHHHRHYPHHHPLSEPIFQSLSTRKQAAEVERESRRHFSQIIYNLRQKAYFMATFDVVVTVRSCSFACHSFILMSESGFFVKRLTGKINNSGKKRCKINLHQPTISSEDFQIIHSWLYTSALHLDDSNVIGVWATAELLEMPNVVNLCNSFVCQVLNPGNAMRFWENAQQKNLRPLRHMAGFMLASKFRSVTHSPAFLHYNVDQVMRLLSDDNIDVSNEKEVFYAAIRWLNYKWPEREQCVEQLLQCVRFTSMTPLQLLECISQRKDSQVLKNMHALVNVIRKNIPNTSEQ